MIQQTIVVKNKIGIHSRPATLLIDTAKKFKSEISVSKGDVKASTKSLIKILALKIKQGNEITIVAAGEDEQDAMKALISLVENKFGED
jgi:phosphocarrier protein HPr